MRKTLDFYFDFGSPTAYLAHKRLQQLVQQYDFAVQYIPMLLGGVFKATGNTTPVAIPAKGRYMVERDLPRFARRYGVPLTMNPHFPINTLQIMRGAIAARRLGCFDDYVDAIYDAMWVNGRNLGEPEVIAATLTAAGLDARALMALAQDPEVKGELAANTEQAVERGAFGAPTLYMDGEMYFGQDRLDFIEEALREAGAGTA
jgi:2-hydroxychromene-2-carboxylate isomerase